MNSVRNAKLDFPNLGPLLWVVGLGLASLAMLVAAFLPFLSDYVISALVISILGLSSSILGLRAWWAAGWVRKTLTEARLEGRSVWPILARTQSKRYVRGLLELREGGLEVRLNNGVAPLDWEDLTVIESTAPGVVRPGHILIEGRKFGHAEIQILQSNAVTSVGEGELQEFLGLVKRLSSNG